MSVLPNSHAAFSQEAHSAEAITDTKSQHLRSKRAPRPVTAVKPTASVIGRSKPIDLFMGFLGPGLKMPSPHTEPASESLSSKPGMETQLLFSESPEEDEENPVKNPFTIPPDIDIFSIRDKERKKAKAERERMKIMKIHEKITYATKLKAKQKGLRKALQKEEEEEARKQATNTDRLKMLQESLSWKLAIKNDYPLEKESFRDYINDRREIFLLEYAMAVKREEIQRLENIAKNEESKVEKAERCLEKDAAMFDEFLKENQKKSIQALKIAKKETAAKAKIIREIQAITSQIQDLQSGISRYKNTLQEYKMYRDYLYQLSPKEWQEKHGKKHTKENVLETTSKANEESASLPTTTEQGQGLAARTNTASPYRTSYVDLSSSLLPPKSLDFRSSLEDAESEICSDEDEEPKLYFTDPQQLLSILMEMEEKFLSFIQNFQETKKSVAKVINIYEIMDKKSAELEQQVTTLKSSIAKEEERAADLKLKVTLFSSGEYEADDQDKMLAKLKKKVLKAYCHCTGENETNLQTVQMLSAIEKQLSDLLESLERLPPAQVEQVMRAKKKERRMRVREEKLKQQKQQQEERLQRARERAQAPVKIMSSKRLMFRSWLPVRKKKQQHSKEQIDKEKEEELYYFT